MNIHELKHGLAVFVASVLILFAATTAYAVPLSLNLSGNGSGQLGGVAFGASDFIITANTDTNDAQLNVEVMPGFFADILPNSSASISITGLGTFDFVDPTQSFFNDQFDVIGFQSGQGLTPLDLYNIQSPALDGWDALTPIGPIAGNGDLLQWNTVAVLVTDGATEQLLTFLSGATPANVAVEFEKLTITPTPVPLPGALPLLASALGVAGFAGWRRRRLTRKAAHQH